MSNCSSGGSFNITVSLVIMLRYYESSTNTEWELYFDLYCTSLGKLWHSLHIHPLHIVSTSLGPSYVSFIFDTVAIEYSLN